MKVFTGDVFRPPRAWQDAAGVPRHVVSSRMAVFALRKADVVPLLTDRGVSQGQADRMGEQLKLVTWRHLPFDVELMIRAEAADPESPGVYLWANGVKNDMIVKVGEDGRPVIVGDFEYVSPEHRMVVSPRRVQ